MAISLDQKSNLGLALSSEQTREIVLLMAQAIVAVHRGAREGQHEDAKQGDQEDDDVNDE